MQNDPIPSGSADRSGGGYQADTADTAAAEVSPQALPQREDANALTVVGLGGSAGSIPALETFFQNVPPEDPDEDGASSAYVVVLHLSPNHESYLSEILARSTKMPVQQVNESVKIERNHVYVIPPGKQLEMADGMLRLRGMDVQEGSRSAIDTFFRTLADVHGPQSAAVVLSGTGADGTLGIRQVKEVGGLSVAQSPLEAQYDAMPRSAIATGMVDYVLPVAAMPAHIAAYFKTSRQMTLPHEAAPSPEQDAEGPDQEAALLGILGHVRAQTGHDFGLYKRATVLRRVGRRLQINGLHTLRAYLDFLQSHPAETGDLVGDLLISVTQFFRDKEVWETLERDVIPLLFQGKQAGEDVRVWVCGCSTGEEAYTIAMLLLERAALTERPPKGIQVFATDMDADAIARARAGVYPETIDGDVSEERRRRWFYRQNGTYQVRKELREAVLFATHDVLRDTPFSRLDLVTCRNLLIYLNREAQGRVLQTFHFALHPEGRLLLGSSESVETDTYLFAPIDKDQHIYIRRPSARLVTPPLPFGAAGPHSSPTTRRLLLGSDLVKNTAFADPSLPGMPPPPRTDGSTRGTGSGARELFLSLLERYGLPTALVDEAHNILHLSNGAGRFLRVADGELTHNLLELVYPDLRIELRTALYAAVNDGTDETRLLPAVPLAEGRPPVPIRVTVRPVRAEGSRLADAPGNAPEATTGYLLVQFEELPAEFSFVDSSAASAPATPSTEAFKASFDVAQRLEEENTLLQRQLRSVIEQHEASEEELKASNEELQALNEELRSTAEELETSKEELQSVNEELTTVNYELKARVEEVSHTNSDLQNFLASTDIGTIFLDRELRIKRYTPAAEALFNLIPADTGRPLAHVTNRLDYPALADDAESVLARLRPVEREVSTTDGERHFLARLLPYRSMDDRIEGVVLTFVDLTERKQAEEEVRKTAEAAAFRVRLADAIRPLDNPLTIQSEAARVLGQHLGASRVYYGDVAPDDQYIVVEQDYADGVASLTGRFRMQDFSPRLIATLRSGRTLVMPRLAGSQELSEAELSAYDGLSIAAQVGVPIIKEERLAAVLSVHQSEPRAWTPDEVALIEATAERIATAVERVRAEEALRGSEERYRTLFNSMDEAYCVIEMLFEGGGAPADYRILELNPAFEKLTGLTSVAGKLIREVVPEIEETWIEQYGTVALTGKPSRFEGAVAGLGGRSYDGYAFRLGGDDSRLVAVIFSEITERKRSEETLRQALESVARTNAELEQRVTERTSALLERSTELADVSNMRQELLRKLVTAQEQERARISRDLHDDTGQQVAALLLGLGNLKDSATIKTSPEAQNALAQLQAVAGTLALKSHQLAFTLRPTALDDIGLMGALQNYTEEWSHWSRVPVVLDIVGIENNSGSLARLPTEIETTIYRVAQEALTNILRHAVTAPSVAAPAVSSDAASMPLQVVLSSSAAIDDAQNGAATVEDSPANEAVNGAASQVNIVVQRSASGVLTIIEDDGPGFDVDAVTGGASLGKRRLGIFGMQERARLAGGILTIESAPGKGTTVFLRLPLR